MARRALRPIERMAEHARSITADRLDDRLPIENPNDELGQLAVVFNDTLGRSNGRSIAASIHSRCIARTPHAAHRHSQRRRGRPQRTARHAGLSGHHRQHAGRSRAPDKARGLPADPSRADAGQAVLQRQTVDLSELAHEVVAELSVLAEEKQQVLRIGSAGPVPVIADRVMLTQAVVNLLHNAIKYSPEAAEIAIVVSNDPEPYIDVVDRGPGIPGTSRSDF